MEPGTSLPHILDSPSSAPITSPGSLDSPGISVMPDLGIDLPKVPYTCEGNFSLQNGRLRQAEQVRPELDPEVLSLWLPHLL